MLSKRSCALVEGAFAVLLAVAPARAERIRMSIEDLPRQDEEVKLKDPTKGVLPDGAKNGAKPPASWKAYDTNYSQEQSHCTDDRRAAVETMSSDSVRTTKIFELDGKEYIDTVWSKVVGGKLEMQEVTRSPLGRVADGIWGVRRKNTVILVMAADEGVFDHAVFYGCDIVQRSVNAPAGTINFSSSGAEAEHVRKEMNAKGKKWTGVERLVRGSVSKSSADPAPMLNLLITTPSPDSL